MLDLHYPSQGTIVVYDLEYTAWPGSMQRRWSNPGEHREILQVGAVKLDIVDNFAELDTFECFVKPRINPQLSDYIVDLTGITQQKIDEAGVDFEAMMTSFGAFHGDASFVAANGDDHEVIQENCALYGQPAPDACFRDISNLFIKALGDEDHVVTGTLPERFGLEEVGPIHNALADARAIAAALRKLSEA